jgi:hypothetical protein
MWDLLVEFLRSEQYGTLNWLNKVSQAIALSNMQGTINHLTDMLEKSLLPPKGVAVGQRGDTLQ